MAEPQKQQMGDGSDNYTQAATQAANAAKNIGKETAKQAAQKGTEAAANAAAATVKASVEGGKAVAEIAAGTASGGPWGAIISAAWAMRHMLFKILICICLSLVMIIVLVLELPGIVINKALGLDGNKPTVPIISIYETVTDSITGIIGIGYNTSLLGVDSLIKVGGYDLNLSMNSLIDNAKLAAGYDVTYIMAAYSTSVEQLSIDQSDMESKLMTVTANMFPITSVVKQIEIIKPVTYYTYTPITQTIVTNVVKTGAINGVPQYRYETAERTYYVQDQEVSTSETTEITAYSLVNTMHPVYVEGVITGTVPASYYQPIGIQSIVPSTEIISYLECTIHPFDNSVIAQAFGIDLNANYNGTNATYGEIIDSRAAAMKRTLYGASGNGDNVPLTDTEMIAFLKMQNCSDTRKSIVETGLSLVGRVPYFWGGKSDAGWNDQWNTPKLVTSAGSTTTGTLRPYGLDCSGFTNWTYKTTIGKTISSGSYGQWDDTYSISSDELLPGDLGFLAKEDGSGWSHVLMFAGYGENGERMWVHSTSGEGVVLNTPNYESTLQLRRVKGVDFGDPKDDNYITL